MTKNWKYALLITGIFSCSSAIGQSLQDGRKALEMDQYQEAKKILSKVVRNENNEINNIALGDAYLKAGKADSAIYFYNQAASKNEKSALGMAAAGKAALVQNNTSEADAKFAAAIKKSKNKDAEVLRVMGSAYLDTEKNLNRGIEYLNKSLDVTKNPGIYVMVGDAYLKQGDGGKAMTAYENAINTDKNYVLGHLRKGQLSARSRQYNDAQASYTTVTQIDPNYAPAYRDLGELYYFVGKYDLALKNYKKYVELAGKTPETRAVYASFLFLTKDYKGTIAEGEEVLKADPNNLVMNRLLAYSNFETGNYDKAQEYMNKYFQVAKPEQVIASDYEYQGKIQAKSDKNEEALTSLNKALEMDSTRADLRYDIAQIYVKQNNLPKAIAMYRNKLKKGKPTNTDYYYLGNLYDQSKNYKAADSLYTIITVNNPAYPQAYLWRARSNANLDPESKAGLAKPHYEKYIELAGGDKAKNKDGLVEANYYLGYYYYLKNDKAKSTTYLKEVLALDPANTQAKTLMGVLTGAKTKTKTKAK
jgi:tetratricopeptide (TPR) repeat protein